MLPNFNIDKIRKNLSIVNLDQLRNISDSLRVQDNKGSLSWNTSRKVPIGEPLRGTRDPYAPFIDGFTFKSNVSMKRIKDRGEVFTPRFIAEQMWTMGRDKSHWEEAFKDFDYSNWTLNDLMTTNFEMAIGTGNISISLLWHQMNYAWILAVEKQKEAIRSGNWTDGEEKVLFGIYMTLALSRLYGSDIDIGSIQVFKYRLLGGNIYSQENIDLYAGFIKPYASGFSSQARLEKQIEKNVAEKLLFAKENWKQSNWKGALITLYEYYTNESVPPSLLAVWKKVVNYNFFVSNLIYKKGPFDPENLVPSFEAVKERRKDLQRWNMVEYNPIDKTYSISIEHGSGSSIHGPVL